jgi:hypothetical protein
VDLDFAASSLDTMLRIMQWIYDWLEKVSLLDHESCGRLSVDAESALSANHTASRKAGFARAERE